MLGVTCHCTRRGRRGPGGEWGLGDVRARVGIGANRAYNPHISLARRPLAEMELYIWLGTYVNLLLNKYYYMYKMYKITLE